MTMARGVCPECGGASCALHPVRPGEPSVQPSAAHSTSDPRDCRTCGLIAPCESDTCLLPPFVD